jgi:Domain of unknown function (DUF5667)
MSGPYVRSGDWGGPVDEELEFRLERYAAARLAPRGAAMQSIRAAVLTELAVRRVAEAERRATRLPWRRRALGLSRRLLAVGLAGALTLGGAAAVMGAAPDSPLYAARIWVESVTLPADPAARAAAHEAQLMQRVNEVESAISSGNVGAIDAALSAYDQEVEAAVGDSGADQTRIAHLVDELGRHVAVLEGLANQVPASASSAMERAIETSQGAVANLQDKTHPAKPTHTPKPGPSHPTHP